VVRDARAISFPFILTFSDRSFFIKGRARVTIFAAEGNARTFDYMAGDVGIVPRNMGHFIENLSDDEPLEVLEIFRAGRSQKEAPWP
jgi:oxalate decarboxylase/phosphoglucose isomerase-like protein (cupin superfamily)